MQGVSTRRSKLQKEKLMVPSFTIGPVGKWPVRLSTLLTWCIGPHYRWTIVGVELVDGQWWWNASLRPERTEHLPVCLSSLSFLIYTCKWKNIGTGERGWRLNKEKPRYRMNTQWYENRKRNANKVKPKTRKTKSKNEHRGPSTTMLIGKSCWYLDEWFNVGVLISTN